MSVITADINKHTPHLPVALALLILSCGCDAAANGTAEIAGVPLRSHGRLPAPQAARVNRHHPRRMGGARRSSRDCRVAGGPGIAGEDACLGQHSA